MTEACAERLRIALAELCHFARLGQSLRSIVQMQLFHLAQLILRAELNAIERGRQRLIIQLCGGLQCCLEFRL